MALYSVMGTHSSMITLAATVAFLAIIALLPTKVVAAEDSSKLESEMSKFYVVFLRPIPNPNRELLLLVRKAELFLLRSEFNCLFFYSYSVNFFL